MKKITLPALCVAACLSSTANGAEAQRLYQPITDEVTPELSRSGEYAVGVQTLDVTNPQQFDFITQSQVDRTLTLEIWYPANVSKEQAVDAVYENETRSGKTFTIQGDAYRDAPIAEDESFPLVVISHGYTGYRQLMYYLGEHLASHGYVVAAIDHTDSTNEDVDAIKAPFLGFPSTLLNRSRDQVFVLNTVPELAQFKAKVDADKAGLIGYSMGGFGAVNTIGGCYRFNPEQAGMFTGVQDEKIKPQVQALLNTCAGGKGSVEDVNPAWKAMVALAPWGGQPQLFDAASLAKTPVPTLYIGGDFDDVSGYEGIRWLYENTGTKDTYLLTYHNARHNIAGHPAPVEALGSELDIGHYYEASWSAQTLNINNEHFTLAMMNCYVKSDATACEYLTPRGSSNQVPSEGKPSEPWKGFDHRYGTGMTLEGK